MQLIQLWARVELLLSVMEHLVVSLGMQCFLSFTGHAGELCLGRQKSWCDGSVTQVITGSFEEVFLWTVLSIKYSIPEAALIYSSFPLQQPSIPKLHRRKMLTPLV